MAFIFSTSLIQVLSGKGAAPGIIIGPVATSIKTHAAMFILQQTC